MFAPNMKEITGCSGNFTVDIHNFYFTPKIFSFISFVLLGWAGVRGVYERENKFMRGFGRKIK
jgi:hypothetical protein